MSGTRRALQGSYPYGVRRDKICGFLMDGSAAAGYSSPQVTTAKRLYDQCVPFTPPDIQRACADRGARRPASGRRRRNQPEHERSRTRPSAGAERRTRRVRASRQAGAGDLRAVLAVRAVDRHGGAVRRQRPAVVRQGQRSRTPGHPALLPHHVRRGHARPQARRPAHADGAAAAHQRLGRRPEREGPLVGILDDRASTA